MTNKEMIVLSLALLGIATILVTASESDHRREVERQKSPAYLFEQCVQELTAPEKSTVTRRYGLGEEFVEVRNDNGVSKFYFPQSGKAELAPTTYERRGKFQVISENPSPLRTDAEEKLSGYDQMMMNGIRACYTKHLSSSAPAALGVGSQ